MLLRALEARRPQDNLYRQIRHLLQLGSRITGMKIMLEMAVVYAQV